MTKLRIYLDDERTEPDGWVRAFTPNEVIALVLDGNVGAVSLDHDLGDDEKIGTGYTVAIWLEEKVYTDPTFICPEIFVHSANGVGRAKIEAAIASIKKELVRRAAAY